MTSEDALVPGLGVFSGHAAHLLRFLVRAPAVFLQPPLELRHREEAKLSRVDTTQMRLDVALEVPQRHAERGRGVSPAERETRRVGHGTGGGQVAASFR